MRPLRHVRANDGVELAVHELGGEGPVLLFGHATGYCAGVWEPVAAYLRNQFRCIAADGRAHGGSGRPGPAGFSWSFLGADVLAILEDLGGGPVFGVGHSAGGTGLMLAEAAKPGTFGGLWCFEPVFFPPRPPGEDEDEEPTSNPMAVAARRRRSAFADRADARAHYAAREPFSRFDAAVFDSFLECGLVADDGGGMRLACRPDDEAEFYEMSGFEETWREVERVHCPVTFATGDQPGAFGAGHAQLLSVRTPYGQPETLKGLSHFGPLENPAAVAASIAEALGPVQPRDGTIITGL